MLSQEEMARLQTFKKIKASQRPGSRRVGREDQIAEEMDYWKKRWQGSTTTLERETYTDKLIKLRAEQTKLLLEAATVNRATEYKIKCIIRAYYYDCARLVAATTLVS